MTMERGAHHQGMSRKAAKVTQADIARAIRAAQQCGAGVIRIDPDGAIHIEPQPSPAVEKPNKPVEEEERIVL
jgi:hypothetical protein